MNDYGRTLKKIRNSLNISQSDISKDIMSQSNYSKVENSEIDIPFSKMIEILNQLGMSTDEFLYLHQDYTKNPGNQLASLSRLKAGDQKQINAKIRELAAIKNPSQREIELLAVFEAIDSISKDNFQKENKKVSMIWERLKEHDSWYLYDIRLINSILYIFPLDTAASIMDLALSRLENYKKLGNTSKLSANLQINYLFLLIENEEYHTALEMVDDLIAFSIKSHLYERLAAAYVRKGIILSHLNKKKTSDYYEKGFEILAFVNNEGLTQALKKEIKEHAKM